MARSPSSPNIGLYFRGSFAAGILSPTLAYRADLEKWQNGAAELTNFFVHTQGGISNRSGTQFVGEQKGGSSSAKLIPFVFNNDQSYVLECGDGYLRFLSRGAYITRTDGTPYEITTPYRLTDVFEIRYDQSADVMTLTHPAYPPHQLRRHDTLDWRLAAISFGAGLSPPLIESVKPVEGNAGKTGTTPGISKVAYAYNITAASTALNTESNTSSIGLSTANYNLGYFQQYGNYNTVAWGASPQAEYYNVYRLYAGEWGLIGTTSGLTFNDENYAPDTTQGPPQNRNPFISNYPTAVCYYQQRHVYGGSSNNPQTLWLSRSAGYTNFDVHTPIRDDDAITATIAAQQVNNIKHLVPMADLLAFSGSGIWKVSGGQTGTAITPTNLTTIPQIFVGSSDVRPIPIKNNVIYVEGLGSHVRELQYDYYAAVYQGADLSQFAEHLFYGYFINDWAFAEFPFGLLWACRSDGVLLGLTYLKEQTLAAWHKHETQGKVRSVTVVPEPNAWGALEHVLYLIVERVISGQTRFYIERMVSRQLGPQNENLNVAWFVDCGLRYEGPPTSSVSGLAHLEGCTVSACIDGKGYTGLTVSGGRVALPRPGSLITIGLPYEAHARTLPLDITQPAQFAIKKRVTKVTCSVFNAAGLELSANDGKTRYPMGNTATGGGMEKTFERQIPSPITTYQAQIDFYQSYPLPCTLTTYSFNYTAGVPT